MSEVVLVMGCPASGKTSYTEKHFSDYHRINRDSLGGKLDDLSPILDQALAEGRDRIVLDNTYKTVESRRGVIEVARRHQAKIRCFWMTTTTDQAMINVGLRMLAQYGRILEPDEIKAEGRKNPGIFPPAAIFGYHSKVKGKEPEPPTPIEGFDEVVKVEFHREWPKDWKNKGIILDYDDTIRRIPDGSGCRTKFPTSLDHIEIMPLRREVLLQYVRNGYRLFGASNQSGIAKGDLSLEEAHACFEHTNRMLGLPIDVAFCPHKAGAAICYCRKPAPGLLLQHMWNHKLDPTQTIFVGDQTTDKTAAARLGVRYFHESDFFKLG